MAVKKFPIEAGHIMMFARSVGDANEIYYDSDYAKTTEPGAVIASAAPQPAPPPRPPPFGAGRTQPMSRE